MDNNIAGEVEMLEVRKKKIKENRKRLREEGKENND